MTIPTFPISSFDISGDMTERGENTNNMRKQSRVYAASMSKSSISDTDIEALVDGELPDHEKRRIMRAILTCRVSMTKLDDLLQQKALLNAYWNSLPYN